MRKLTMLVITVIILLSCLCPAYPVPQPIDRTDPIPLTFTIERAVAVRLAKDELAMTVTSDMFFHNWAEKVLDTSPVIIDNNCPVVLKAPKLVPLIGPGLYDATAQIALLGSGTDGALSQDSDFWYLNLESGGYDGATPGRIVTLEVGVEKDWVFSEDAAGVYLGTITLQVYSQL